MTDSSSQGWPARNTNSIRLRTSDGRRGEVKVSKVETTFTPEQIEAALAERATDKQAREATAAKQKTREMAKLRNKKANEKHAAARHAPSGWKPANQRKDYIDPLAKDNDPRRRKGLGK